MYRHCIYCSADLGANETLEAFPVGRTVAFDAAKGRLWAVCRKCARWNLAPIEERWEAVEEAEKRFADTRLRVQRENIGVAKAPDGTRLVRVGKALPGELAAWRYGDQFVGRRRRFLLVYAGGLAVGAGVFGLAAAAGIGVGTVLFYLAGWAESAVKERRIVHRLAPESSTQGTRMVLQRRHLQGARLAWSDGLQVQLPIAPSCSEITDPLVVEGPQALRLLERAMLGVNGAGARRREVDGAVATLVSAGTPGEFLADAARKRRRLELDLVATTPSRPGVQLTASPLRVDEALALEMALHEEHERRVLEGELKLLESAWREAEEIAAIADRLVASAEAG